MSKFKFTLVRKPNIGGNFRTHPEPRADTVRLTTKNIIIGKELISTYKGRRKAAYVTIEKDITSNAIRLVSVPKGTENSYSLCMGSSKSDLHSVKPVGLADMSNGNYKDVGEGIFVLDMGV